MAHCIALFCVLLFGLTLGSGPTNDAIEVVWSEGFKSKKSAQGTQMIGADEQRLYVVRDEPGRDGRYLLDVFNRNSMVRETERVIYLPEIPGHRVSFDRIVMLGQRLLLIVNGFDAGDTMVRSYGVHLGNDGMPQDIPVLLAEASARKRGAAAFGYEISRDGSLMLVYPGNPSEQKVTERFSYRVVDANLETLWDKNLDLPQSAELLEIGSYRLDSRGRLYIMSGVLSPDKTLRGAERQRSERNYVVICFDAEAGRIKEFDVAVDGKWVVASSFDLDENDNPVVGGFYSNDRYFSIAGTFFLRINADSLTVEATGMKPFGKALVSAFNRNERGGQSQEMEDLYFDHFLVRPDGGAVFVAEQYEVQQRWRTDITTGRQEILYYYHYGDLLVVDVAPDGNINWTVRVPKEQVSINDRGMFSSYALMTDGDAVHLLFNDHPENVGLLASNPTGVAKPLNSLKRSTAALVTLNRAGEIERKNLFKNNDSEVILRPKIALSTRQGEVFLYAQYRKSYRFGRLAL